MLKMGIPRQGVENKMLEEGVDPALLDGSSGSSSSSSSSSQQQKLDSAATDATIAAAAAAPKKKKRKKDGVKRKKLFWEALDKHSLPAAMVSIWSPPPRPSEGGEGEGEGEGEEEPPIKLNLCAFKRLFTEQPDDDKKRKEEEEATAARKCEESKKQVGILDVRRDQNASIALSRVRCPFDEIRGRVATLDDTPFSATQIQALRDYLPTPDERMLLTAFSGDVSCLSPAELYMREMMALPSASSLLSVMLFKRHHGDKADSLREAITHISRACESIIGSTGLRIAFQTIRQIGNEMNGTNVYAFSLTSLPSLTSTKAFDKKTTVLRYLIQELTARGQEEGGGGGGGGDADHYLTFPEDLPSFKEAMQVTFRAMGVELNALCTELKGVGLIVAREVDAISKDTTHPRREPLVPSMLKFLHAAAVINDELQTKLESSRVLFKRLLGYLGVMDQSVTPEAVLAPITEFVQVFSLERSKAKVEDMVARRKTAVTTITR
jgi:hypothetical protein